MAMALAAHHAAGEAVARKHNRETDRINMRHDIPHLPETAVKALGMLADTDVNLRILAGVLAEDHRLAARILAIGRSGYYRQRTLPNNLQTALQVIGLRDLRNIIFAGFIRSVLSTRAPVADALWAHSLAAALAGRILSARLTQVDPEHAFLAGLLHDAGQILLMHEDAAGYIQLTNEARREKTPLVEAERARYGISHQELGVSLIESWNLDAEMVQAVAVHHDDHESDKVKSLGALVAAADYLTLKTGLGFFAATLPASQEMLSAFGLDNEADFARAVALLRHAFDTEGALLNTA
jgi:HD-like signal output (HDOD) protein